MNPTWLLGYDFSTEAPAILEQVALELSKLGGHLYILHVFSFPSPPTSFGIAGSETTFTTAQEFSKALFDQSEEQLLKIKEDLVKRFPGVTFDVMTREGNAVEEIIAVAKEKNVERLVVGTHGRRGVGRFLMGSVAERVVRLSPVSVLVVKTIHP